MEAITLVSALEIGATAISTYGAMSASAAQQQQSLNNAAIAEQNASQAMFEANVGAQEQDFAARQELGDLIAASGASGLNLGSGSTFLQRKSKEELAAKDRARIVHSGEIEKINLQNQADDFAAEASAASRSSFFDLLGGGIDIGSSLVSGATGVTKKKTTTITGKSS